MTTRVIISVPDDSHGSVAVFTSPENRTEIGPGKSHEFHVWSGGQRLVVEEALLVEDLTIISAG